MAETRKKRPRDSIALAKLIGDIATGQTTDTLPDDRNPPLSRLGSSVEPMRIGMRRFTRRTNAFSNKLANHMHALSIRFMHYNFARIHQTLSVTPAMASSVTET
jgi:hypothetical protein